MTYVSPAKIKRISANVNAIAERLTKAQRHQSDLLAQHDGWPTSAPMNGSEGIGRSSGLATSSVERAALGAGLVASARLERYTRDADILDVVSARLLADIDAGLPPVAPPVLCNGGLGRDGADQWGFATCDAIATRGPLCDKHRMRERRWRAVEGLAVREDDAL
jgi:hypothetical protein